MIELEYIQEDSVRVYYNESHCSVGSAGKVAIDMIITKEMLPIKKITGTLIGRDQNWGNTGHSSVALLILDQQDNLIYNFHIGITYHEENEYNIEIIANNILLSLKEGWKIGIWAISAPYPGYECVVRNAKLIVTASFLWERRKNWILFLYDNKYQTLLNKSEIIQEQEIEQEIEQEQDTDSLLKGEILSQHQVFCNKDLCRYITMFL
mmetsp:Transcript_20730/g.21383  ORF Transcript_20730/g.21383 Transcript_20730/m.21383 type:complete len:208 (+) Transcript_20730:3-626(+)